MIIKKYLNYLNENKTNNYLRYYMFDWDDNILVMDTKILVDKLVDGVWKPVDLSTKEYSDVRKYIEDDSSIWRYRDNNPNMTYSEFRDWGKRGENAFFDDTISAIKNNNFGPVWDKFIECLCGGHIFMIITARGHEPYTIKKTVKWIILNYLNKEQKQNMENNLREFNLLFRVNDVMMNFEDLIDNYLDLCYFIGITSTYFANLFNIKEGTKIETERFKLMAIKYFTKIVNNYGKEINKKVKVGFSDDDILTTQHIYKYLKDKLWYEIPIDYYVYNTKSGVNRLI